MVLLVICWARNDVTLIRKLRESNYWRHFALWSDWKISQHFAAPILANTGQYWPILANTGQYWFHREMTPEERAQKLHTDDTSPRSLLLIGHGSSKICINQSEVLARSWLVTYCNSVQVSQFECLHCNSVQVSWFECPHCSGVQVSWFECLQCSSVQVSWFECLHCNSVQVSWFECLHCDGVQVSWSECPHWH